VSRELSIRLAQLPSLDAALFVLVMWIRRACKVTAEASHISMQSGHAVGAGFSGSREVRALGLRVRGEGSLNKSRPPGSV
jgi:hypothetical protein